MGGQRPGRQRGWVGCPLVLLGVAYFLVAPRQKPKKKPSFLFFFPTHPNGETVKRNTEFLYCARALEFEPASCS